MEHFQLNPFVVPDVFFEKTNNLTTAFQDLKPTEALSFLPVIILIIVMGVFPQIFIQKIEPAAQQQVAKVFTMTQGQVADTTAPTPGQNNHTN